MAALTRRPGLSQRRVQWGEEHSDDSITQQQTQHSLATMLVEPARVHMPQAHTPRPGRTTPRHDDDDDFSRPMVFRRRKARASDGLPLPLWLTNTFFAIAFVLSTYYLLARWRIKTEASEKLHLLSWGDLVAIVLDLSSFIYMIGFCGIGYVQSTVEQVDSDEETEPIVAAPTQPAPPLPSPPSKSCLATGKSVFTPLSPHSAAANARRPSPGSQEPDNLSLDGNSSRSSSSQSLENGPRVHKESLDKECGQEDETLAQAVAAGDVPSHSLEARLGDAERAAAVRRRSVEIKTGRSLAGLPLNGYDYEAIRGACCEMVIGHVQIPVGVAGPLLLDGREFVVPMATTEGCLVASTNRGCKAIFEAGGAMSVVLQDGMSRAPVVQMPSVVRAAELRGYLERQENFDRVAQEFNKTSRFARLLSIKCAVAGRNVFVRFFCTTGDAMGMNMVSKGVQSALGVLADEFPDMRVLSLSGNFCADKKPTAVNWIEGRGKSVVCEAVIPARVVQKVLKTSVATLVELNTAKNLVGSAMAGAVGGFNAHASNIVTALYLATGQDPAQNVESSQCITLFESINGGEDLHASVTLPSVEVGTVGGGTFLAPQAAALSLLGVKGAHETKPGENARQLARIVAGAVLAGELSLMAALAEGHLVKSHLKYNRSATNLAAAAAAAVASVDSGAAGASAAAPSGSCLRERC